MSMRITKYDLLALWQVRPHILYRVSSTKERNRMKRLDEMGLVQYNAEYGTVWRKEGDRLCKSFACNRLYTQQRSLKIKEAAGIISERCPSCGESTFYRSTDEL